MLVYGNFECPYVPPAAVQFNPNARKLLVLPFLPLDIPSCLLCWHPCVPVTVVIFVVFSKVLSFSRGKTEAHLESLKTSCSLWIQY